jgi:hypothetical protein
VSGIRLLTNSALYGANTAASTLVVTSGVPLAGNLNDHDGGPQWIADAPSAQAITVDTQAAQTLPIASALALVHHNLAGVRIGVYGSADGTTFAKVADAVVNADPFSVAIPTASYRYWRVWIPDPGQPVLAAPARVGELLLGSALSILDNPNLPTGKPAIVGNVARDRSPAGYPWNTRKGASRRRYEYRWNALPDADLATLRKAFAECGEGAQPLVLVDQLGTALWVTWEDTTLPQPGALGVQLQEMSASFEEVPQ